jgi:hypothetical protein
MPCASTRNPTRPLSNVPLPLLRSPDMDDPVAELSDAVQSKRPAGPTNSPTFAPCCRPFVSGWGKCWSPRVPYATLALEADFYLERHGTLRVHLSLRPNPAESECLDFELHVVAPQVEFLAADRGAAEKGLKQTALSDGSSVHPTLFLTPVFRSTATRHRTSFSRP